MHMFSVLRDSWHFFSHNLLAITRLCLPLIVLEGLFLQQVSGLVRRSRQMPGGCWQDCCSIRCTARR